MDQLNQHIADSQLYYADTATPLLKNGGKPGRELFLDDGLYLNQTGYALWESVLSPILQQVYNQSLKQE
ncbi:MAG: hypothetical protein Q7J65_06255 [Candidatus Marinimicrobia bacterium]|nr:hypothetical protein [Candidatus Neomarinimicrobiota bacterium]